jgi:hypothetical protein
MATKKTYNILDAEYVELLKDANEIDDGTFYPHDLLASLGNSVSDFNVSLGVLGANEEDEADEQIISILQSEFSNQPYQTWIENKKKDIDSFTKELKKAYEDITGEKITFKNKEELINANRAYIKSAMGTERMHLELVYSYNIK